MSKSFLYDYLIIGGGVAGVTAAEEIRLRDSRSTIAIVSEEEEPLYSRVLLPHYLRGKVLREKVYLRSFDSYAKHRIDFLGAEKVIGINFDLRTIQTSRRRTFSFKKLLIATGGEPQVWTVPGAESRRVLQLQTLADADRVRALITKETGKNKSAVIVGGGFIGTEFLETAAFYGYKTHLLMRDRQFFGDQFDEQGWAMLKKNFASYGVAVHAETEVSLIEEKPDSIIVHTSSGEKIEASWLGVGNGLRRNIDLADTRVLKTNRGIITNARLETSVRDVWAAGDVAEFYDPIFDEYRTIGNWTNAVVQGNIAGANMAGAREQAASVSTYSITSLGFYLTFVGRTDFDQETDAVVRVWPEQNEYERLFFRKGLLVGAVLINRFRDKITLSKIIAERRDVSRAKEALRDPYINLEALLV